MKIQPANNITSKQQSGESSSAERACTKERLYYRRPVGKPFSTLLLDYGHESILLHIASFLAIRSISALSCVSQRLDKILAEDALYCQASSMALPCMKEGPAIPLSISGSRRARSLALESTLFWKSHNQSRERSLTNILTIPHRVGSMLDSRLSMYGNAVTYTTDNGDILSCRLSNASQVTSSNHHQQGASIYSKPTISKRLFPKDSLGVISSCCAGVHRAVLYMPSNGLRRYVLSVGSITNSSTNGINWQRDIIQTSTSSSPGCCSQPLPPKALSGHISRQRYSVKIDALGRWVIVAFKNHVAVFSGSDGSVAWEFSLEKEHQDWYTWILHGRYIVAITSSRKHLLIYSLELRRRVASGQMPPKQHRRRGQRSSNSNLQEGQVPTILVCGERVWWVQHFNLICTGCIFRRLDRQCTQTTADEQIIAKELRIKQFHVVALLRNEQPILKDYRETIFVADGDLIKIFKPERLASVLSSFGKCATIDPCLVLSAEGTINFLQADSTKIVCGVNSGKKKLRIEVFMRPEVAFDSRSLYHSVFVKNASVFCDRYEYRNIEFRGRRLLVELSKTSDCTYLANGAQVVQKSQLHIYNLFDWDY